MVCGKIPIQNRSVCLTLSHRHLRSQATPNKGQHSLFWRAVFAPRSWWSAQFILGSLGRSFLPCSERQYFWTGWRWWSFSLWEWRPRLISIHQEVEENSVKIPKSRVERFLAGFKNCLQAMITAKRGVTKYWLKMVPKIPNVHHPGNLHLVLFFTLNYIFFPLAHLLA